jgi:hemerythrin-like metal-binding protein
VEWRPEYELGVGAIDAQHQRLFASVGDLLAAIGRGETNAVGPMLTFLRRYALEHFADEQALMSATAYPLADAHAAEHARFALELFDVQARFDRDPRSPWLAAKLGVGLSDWLRDHVLGSDAALGRHLRARTSQRQ